jgi:hypothetical protein
MKYRLTALMALPGTFVRPLGFDLTARGGLGEAIPVCENGPGVDPFSRTGRLP